MSCPMCQRPPRNKDILTKREAEIAAHFILGKSQREVSEALFVHVKTVKFHLTSVYRKLKARNQSDLVARYYLNRLDLEQETIITPYLRALIPDEIDNSKKETRELPKGISQ